MITAYKVIIVIVAVIIVGALAYYIMLPYEPNCDPTVAYTMVDNVTGQAPDGTQCYCATDTIDTNGQQLASWIQQNNTQFYNCVYA